MLESTRLSEQKFNLEKKLRSERFTALTGQEDDFQARMGEVRAMYDQIDDLNLKIVEATDREEQEAAVAMARIPEEHEDRLTPELKELRELGQKISLVDYLRAAEEERAAPGAAGEYNTHVFGVNRPGDMPIELLMDREAVVEYEPRDWQDIKDSEHRASLTGVNVNPGASANYVSQLFSTSESAFMGGSFPAVGVGDHSYPIFSKVTTAGDLARDAEESTPSGSMTINTATNRRIQATMELNAEDENRIPNIANGLVAHLRMQIQSELDEYVIEQLVAGLTEVDDNTTLTLSRFLTKVGAAVDGIGARNIGDIRGLINTIPEAGQTVNPSVFGLLSGSSLGSGGSHFSELPYLSDPNYYRGSAHLPAVDASDEGKFILCRTGLGLNLRRLMVPIWRRGQLLRNTAREQRRARIQYTVAMFAAAELTATDQHILHNVDVA